MCDLEVGVGVGFVPQFHQDGMGWRWGSYKKDGVLPPKQGGRDAEYMRTSSHPKPPMPLPIVSEPLHIQEADFALL